jgi:hypothetical protein
MLHFGGCLGLWAHCVKDDLAPVPYKRSVSLLPPFTLHFLISFVFLEEMNTLQVAISLVLPMPIPHGGRDGEVQQ